MNIYFSSLADFFAMGGHAAYVWICYAVVLLLLVAQLLVIRLSFKKQQKQLKRYYQQIESAQLNQDS